VGFHFAKATDAGDTARSAKDRAWLEQDYPSIGRGQSATSGDLLERRDGYLQPGSDRQRLRAKRQTPILTQTGQKFSTSMIAPLAIAPHAVQALQGALNVAIFIDFMKRLLKDAKQKSF